MTVVRKQSMYNSNTKIHISNKKDPNIYVVYIYQNPTPNHEPNDIFFMTHSATKIPFK